MEQLEGTVVYKMTGSGNDFVMVDGRTDPPDHWTQERVRVLCARGTGAGADGLVVLEPGSGPAAVRFHFFNCDGLRSTMCGNAALCSVRLSAWLELAPPEGMVLETDSGPVPGRCLRGAGERAEIELPMTTPLLTPDVPLAMGERLMRAITVGVPHLVVLVDDLEAVPILERGRELRAHPVFAPAGANVNFVSDRGGLWSMRTYERGVEGETLACGTGAVASAATLASTSGVSLPLSLLTRSGAELVVNANLAQDGRLERPLLAGQGRLTYRGILSGASGHRL
jgi:diaminopimelate epimerase